jgi:hypothetical protein
MGRADDLGIAGRINPETNGSAWANRIGKRTSVKRNLPQSTPCFSRQASVCSQAELLMTSTAMRLPSRSSASLAFDHFDY